MHTTGTNVTLCFMPVTYSSSAQRVQRRTSCQGPNQVPHDICHKDALHEPQSFAEAAIALAVQQCDECLSVTAVQDALQALGFQSKIIRGRQHAWTRTGTLLQVTFNSGTEVLVIPDFASSFNAAVPTKTSSLPEVRSNLPGVHM